MQRGTRMEMISYCIPLRKPVDLCSFSSALHCIRWGSVPLYAAIRALTVLKQRQDFGSTHVMCDNLQRNCEKLCEVKLLRFLLTFPDFEAHIFYPFGDKDGKQCTRRNLPLPLPYSPKWNVIRPINKILVQVTSNNLGEQLFLQQACLCLLSPALL